MQEKKSDISCKETVEQKKHPVDDSESEKIKNIRIALNELSKREEENEIRNRITENVKLFKDQKENPEKYEREKRIKELLAEKKEPVVKERKISQNKKHRKIKRRKKRISGGIIPRKGDTASELLRKSVFWLSACIFTGCMIFLGTELYSRYDTKQKYDDISSKYGNSENKYTTIQPTDAVVDNSYVQEATTEEATYEMIPGAANLLKLSSDVVGYISIPDTVINYPVMQNKDDVEGEEFFLEHDFYGNSSHLGSIYLDFRCNFDVVGNDKHLSVPTSDNLIVYGHDMRDESMFGSLRKYVGQNDYYEKHPIIEINSNYCEYTFKIYGYFIADATDTTDTRFEYWNYIDFQNEDEFYSYVNEIKRRTLRLTDVDVKYGDRLLTLSTCSSVISNGRLVVCARMLREGENLYDGVSGSKPNPNIKWPTIHWDSSSYDPKAEFVPYG